MTRAEAVDRIRKMLALADPKSNGTGPERATARRMAEKFMAENGVTEEEARGEPAKRRAPPPPEMHQKAPQPRPGRSVYFYASADINSLNNQTTTGAGFFFVIDE